MRSSERINLPQAGVEYSQYNEEQLRRAVEQFYAVLRDDIVVNRDTKDAPSSLALRRHQFLLMGA